MDKVPDSGWIILILETGTTAVTESLRLSGARLLPWMDFPFQEVGMCQRGL